MRPKSAFNSNRMLIIEQNYKLNIFMHMLKNLCAHVPPLKFSCAVVHMRLKKFVPDRQKLCNLHKKKSLLPTNLQLQNQTKCLPLFSWSQFQIAMSTFLWRGESFKMEKVGKNCRNSVI